MSWIQFKDTTRIEPRVPWYVYGAAILLMGWASFVLWAWLSLSEFGPQFWKNMVLVGLELTIGSGLLFHRRWAWVLGIVTSVLFIGQALRLIVSSGASWRSWSPSSISLPRRSSSSLLYFPGGRGVPSSGRGRRMPAEPTDEGGDLRALLETLEPKSRDDLRRVLIRDQADRNVIRASWEAG